MVPMMVHHGVPCLEPILRSTAMGPTNGDFSEAFLKLAP